MSAKKVLHYVKEIAQIIPKKIVWCLGETSLCSDEGIASEYNTSGHNPQSCFRRYTIITVLNFVYLHV